MPIRINLLAEAQAAEDMRRRDPVKRGIWIGGFLICVVLLWCGKLQLDILREGMTRERLEKDWGLKEPQYKRLVATREKADRLNGLLNGLDRYSTNRFLWANVLNAVQHTVIDDIQVTHFKGEQTFDVVNPENATNTTPSGPVVKHTPGCSTEHIRLVLDARDFNNQNQTWTKYKETLSNNDFFKRHLKRVDGFVLDGTQSAPTRDPLDPVHEFVSFTLVSRFPEVKRYE
jgi:hypothetical protein